MFISLATNASVVYDFAGIKAEQINVTGGVVYSYEKTSGDSIPAVDYTSAGNTMRVSFVHMENIEFNYKLSLEKQSIMRFDEDYTIADGKNIILRFSNLNLGDTISLLVSAKGGTDATFTAFSGANGEDQIAEKKDETTGTYTQKTVSFYATSSEAEIKEITGGFRIYNATVSRFECSEATEYFFRDTLYTCEGDPFYLHGISSYVAHTDTVIEDSLVTLYGCDSIMKTYFTVNPRYKIYELVPIAVGDTSIFYKGMHLTLGDNPVYFATIDGCDSIWHYMVQEDETITNGESEVKDTTSTTVTIEWISDSAATQYTISIYTSGTLFAQYIVDGAGNVIDTLKAAPKIAQMPKKKLDSRETFTISIGGLTPGSSYTYTIVGTNIEQQPVYYEEGSFQTTKEGLGIPTISSDPDKPRKILYEGRIYILRNGKTYDLLGR